MGQILWSVLKHRAQVSRATKTQNPANGQWTNAHVEVGPQIRCLFVPKGWQEDQMQSVDVQSEATGSLFAAPKTDLKPGDRVTLTDGRKFTVGSRGGLAYDSQGHAHHQQWEVTQ